MKNLFALVIVILAISSVTEAKKRICRTVSPATSVNASPKECYIGYYDIAPQPTCEITTNENNEEVQFCSSIGSAAYLAVLAQSFSSFSADWGISAMDYTGYCNCVLQLWSGPNQTGDTFTYPFGNNPDNPILISDLWDQLNESFEIACQF